MVKIACACGGVIVESFCFEGKQEFACVKCKRVVATLKAGFERRDVA